ncbi:MAG: prepilin-type N-terminal cleavage/methylation domain-containing protein [Acidobacteriia bacterium]|nr:prepilin-type N-terminal cleavage/methylation domain-containing protein [Terriglobia bacterium]
MRNRPQTQRILRAEGFTLLEMLVSVTLVALMALSIWAVLRISIASWKRGTESIDANQRHRATLDLMQKQVASVSAMIPPVDLQTGAGQAPIFEGSQTSVEFISLCSLRFRDNPGLTVVSYGIVPSNQGEFALVEQETRYLGGDPTQYVDFAEGDQPATTIFDHLTSGTFEYLDPGTADRPSQWVTDWSAVDLGRLPTAMSITLNTRDAVGALQSRKLVIPFMAEVESLQPGFIDPFDGRMVVPGGPPSGGRRGGPGSNNPPGGRRGGSGFDNPPGGRRGGPGPGNPPPGGRRGGR